jgi:hypothetical protein
MANPDKRFGQTGNDFLLDRGFGGGGVAVARGVGFQHPQQPLTNSASLDTQLRRNQPMPPGAGYGARLLPLADVDSFFGLLGCRSVIEDHVCCAVL